ncbi:DNA repair protein RecN [Rivibacter subsaxonicus]|uniref:DNA repair protein RecN n=1 Tax=Rivibacter subsaxonicus TaxID=457575 RepID=A0A4Q7VZ66_9BURK|nr:DNA repair protein RecN [Rivibacter subsaxonicus]RZU02152.1 DNA replication and repair protein RecN [Rivibacter subsaxonicus]
MLRRLALRDFVIVPALELEFSAGFSALTGETGAGKSILVDALQLALGARGDAGVVREGALRAEVSAEFDALSPALRALLDEAGIDSDDGTLLLRRTIDAQGKSRAWINGSAATVAQLREFGEQLLDIHGQHAWQGLTRPESVRALLDAYAGFDGAPLAAAFGAWRAARDRLDHARTQQADLERERERLAWQINELAKLAPAEGEWPELEAEHRRLSHAQSIIDALQLALDATTEADEAADARLAQAIDALDGVLAHDAALAEPLEVLRSAQAQLQDAAHTLGARLRHGELDPARLAELDARLSAWMSLARRFRRPPEELPALLAQWQAELAQLDAATDLATLERDLTAARAHYEREAKAATQARRAAAPKLGAAVSAAMQQLGMAGGRFEAALEPVAEPQRFGLENVDFRVAGHAGSSPRALAKVASGGELSRIALAISVTTSELAAAQGEGAQTLIFDEVDAGVGGTVADTVGALMKRLGAERQVLTVTHLPQVAACADHHLVVSKRTEAGRTHSTVQPVAGAARTSELARMLGGEGATSLAHAQALLSAGAATKPSPRRREKA